MSNPKRRNAIVLHGEKQFGPEWADLLFSLGGKGDGLEFPVAGGGCLRVWTLIGSMAAMDRLNKWKGLIPPWGSKLRWYHLEFVGYCAGVPGADRDPKEYEAIYCSGPASKDRWGLATLIGGLPGDVSGYAVELHDALVMRNMLNQKAVHRSDGLEYKCFISPDCGIDLLHKHLGSIQPLVSHPHPLIHVDFQLWTLSWRKPDIDDGAWHHAKLADTTEQQVIQINTVVTRLNFA